MGVAISEGRWKRNIQLTDGSGGRPTEGGLPTSTCVECSGVCDVRFAGGLQQGSGSLPESIRPVFPRHR